MNTIGETLRRERARQGLDLPTISQRTKIGTRMLLAMEAGDFSKLPGGVFTRSFIRQYAEALGIDSAYIETELEDFRPAPEEAPKPVERLSMADRPASMTSAATSAVWVAVAILCCGGVYYFMRTPDSANPAPATPHAAEQASEQGRPNEVSNVQPKVVEPQPPLGQGALQVVLSASEASWVSISVDGKLKFSGILQPNDRREINAEERVKVVAGNAGGIDILLNGKNIEALGPKGQVRTVELTRAGAQVVSRAPNSEPLL